MRCKSYKDKIDFIEQLNKEDNFSIVTRLNAIRKLSQDKNTEVRIALARQLVLYDREEIEDILYEMLSDKCRRVRLEAMDTLSVGRKIRTIEKVSTMLVGEGQLIRAYAVATLFDMLVNCCGMNTECISKYFDYVKASFNLEKDPRVLMEYYMNQYLSGDKKGLQKLKEFYIEAVEERKYELIWPLLHVFDELMNIKNKEIIDEIIIYGLDELLENQQNTVKRMLLHKPKIKILVLDQDNTYASHIIGTTLREEADSYVQIDTAGMTIGHVKDEKIDEFCKRNGIPMEHKPCFRKVTSVYSYDYVICVNLEKASELFSLCNIMEFKDINEFCTDQKIYDICKSVLEGCGIKCLSRN